MQRAKLGRGMIVCLAAFALIAAWGIRMYTQQLQGGLAVTGLNRPVFWGLYVTNFIFCVGMSAGGIAVSAFVHLRGRSDLKPVAVLSEILATCFLVLAMSFVLMDLGRPGRVFSVLRHPNPWSPLFWDVVVLSSYLLLCLGLLYFSVRADLVRRYRCSSLTPLFALGYTDVGPAACARDHRILRVLAAVSIPAAVALHSVTAWILGLVKAQPGWNTPILAPLFVTSALVSGMAGVLLVTLLSRRSFALEVGDDSLRDLSRWLAVLLPALLYLLWSEFLTVAYSDVPQQFAVLRELVDGRFARIFWFDVVCGIVVPMVLLVVPRSRNRVGLGLAAVLVIVGVFAERTYLLLPSLLRPELAARTGALAYRPTLVEWSLMAGVYALGGLVFVAGMMLCFGARPRQPAARYAKAPGRPALPLPLTARST